MDYCVAFKKRLPPEIIKLINSFNLNFYLKKRRNKEWIDIHNELKEHELYCDYGITWRLAAWPRFTKMSIYPQNKFKWTREYNLITFENPTSSPFHLGVFFG